jgi:hypothetical protein
MAVQIPTFKRVQPAGDAPTAREFVQLVANLEKAYADLVRYVEYLTAPVYAVEPTATADSPPLIRLRVPGQPEYLKARMQTATGEFAWAVVAVSP